MKIPIGMSLPGLALFMPEKEDGFFIKNWGGSISIPVQQMVFGAGTQPTIRGGGHVSRK